MKINVNKIKGIFIYLAYIVFAFIIAFAFGLPEEVNLELMGILGWGLLIISFITWRIITGEFITAYTFYLGVLYLFFYGQSLLIPFDLVTPERDLILRYSFINENNLFEAQVYSFLCLASFHLGGLLFYKVNKLKDEPRLKKLGEKSISDKAILATGISLFIVSVIPYIYGMFQSLILVKMYGYSGVSRLDAQTGLNSLMGKMSLYFIPSLLCLTIAVRNSKVLRTVVQVISGMVIFSILYIGERNDAIVFILALVLIQHYFIRKISLKQSLKYIVSGVVLLSLLTTIADIRNMEGRTVFDYFEYMMINSFNNNFITELISELGSSMMPTIAIMGFVDSGEPLRNGTTYLYSLLSIVPNLGFWDLHPAAQVASLGQWLKFRLGLSFGPGFSLAAESYLNFAWWGFFIFIFLGAFISKILGLLNKTTVKYYPAIACFVLIFFNSSLFYIRDTFLGNIRAIFYMGLPIYLLIIFFNNRVERRKKEAPESKGGTYDGIIYDNYSDL
ncbi:O-antigen polysaccharide polymerase Wzy [Bacillus solimangrovi]|uniref:Oligosaccharide repeat unit polymerase n=1 Tax=Bacillus solimangrovi TaxID=1305675 RepID=A0A1E5LDI3_9BACI|nr:O-antigen polysaccharide polymerase Wzy [Bacillus solimangrovi]OEH92143.1 hypothetical protein BFG57_02400 [Bacillus solimangrovi]